MYKLKTLPEITEIEEKTADLWREAGTIRAVSYGNENTYYIDELDREYFCKNYPEHYGDIMYMNSETGSVGVYDDWDYEDESGAKCNAVDLGEVVEVTKINNEWHEV